MRYISLFLFLSIFNTGHSQEDSVLYNRLWKNNQQGMIVLSSWGAGNIMESLYFTPRTNGSVYYFHQMNGLWNTVNLGLGVAGIIKSRRMLKQQNITNFPDNISKVEKAYRINFYIDFAYIAGGTSLWTLNQNFNRNDLAIGYGQSLVTQGLFLLGFDYVMMRLLKRRINLLSFK